MITVVDYGAGNIRSVCLALEKIQIEWQVTDKPEEIAAAERIIFPGVGAAKSAMDTLKARGLEASLKEAVAKGTPFLGICLGTQIIFSHSEENDGVEGLNILEGNVIKFELPKDVHATIPHMGWNQVQKVQDHPLFDGIEDNANFYFVHSYYPVPSQPDILLAKSDYAGLEFCCAVVKDNLVATQFHPEKSGRHGLDLLANFAKWRP